MGTRLQGLIIGAVLLGASSAFAGTKVLGVEIGVTTVEQLETDLSEKVEIEAQGTNKFTSGPMFATKGDSYEIEGLTKVVYIFDDKEKLAGVIMEMSQTR